MKAPDIVVQRVYEGLGPEGGYRALVDRMWPRGLSREELGLDVWARDVAPSTELRKWFCHKVELWPEFRRRYLEELAAPEEQERLRALLADAGRRPLVLLYGARDTEHNQAVVLREALQALADKRAGSEPAAKAARTVKAAQAAKAVKTGKTAKTAKAVR